MKNKFSIQPLTLLITTVMLIFLGTFSFGQSYLPLTGGTLTGNLNLSSGTQLQSPYLGFASLYTAQPANSNYPALFPNSTTSTFDFVGARFGWQFVPSNSSSYATPVFTIDQNGWTKIQNGVQIFHPFEQNGFAYGMQLRPITQSTLNTSTIDGLFINVGTVAGVYNTNTVRLLDLQLGIQKGAGHTINYASGIVLSATTAGSNNCDLCLLANNTDAPPTGNFAFYNNSGYNNYFKSNVGIGTVTPSQKLTVLMDGTTNGTGVAVQAVNASGLGSQPGISYLNLSANRRMYSFLDVNTDSYNIANAASSNLFTILQTGNVGIGTSNPQYKLAVNGVINGSNILSNGTNSYFGSGLANTTFTGTYNTFVGSNSGNAITTSSFSILLGSNIGNAITTGSVNTIIGSMNPSLTGNLATAQNLTTGVYNLLIGAGAGGNITTSSYNVAVGPGALALGTGGSYNTTVGINAGISTSGSYNSFFGPGAGNANTTGNQNVFIGYFAGRANTTGSNLTFLGNGAGYLGTSDGLTNATAIGYNATVTASNSLILGNAVNVGIGTTAPAQKLTVVMDGTTNGTGVAIQAVNASGTGSQPGVSYLNNSASKRIYSYLDVSTDSYNIANASSTNLITISQTGNVSIGTSNPHGFMLAVNGTEIATAVTVQANANWPDYVFKTSYHLPSLSDVKLFIDKNHHLPEMPSAQKIEKDGQNLGEMNKLLVKKVEELTLYLIEKDKKEKEQEARLRKLEELVEKLSKSK